MNARVGQDTIEDMLSSVSIISLIAPHVQLKRRGREHIGLCPFHNERSPSFTVNDEKGFYHCFGCAAHGRHIDFIMRFSGLNFPDALQRLADGSGFRLDERIDPAERARRDAKRRVKAAKIEAEERANLERARRIFDSGLGKSIDGTPAGIYAAQVRRIDKSLQRCDPPSWWESVVYAADADMLPGLPPRRAIIAAMCNTVTGEFAGVQRCYLNADGTPVKIKDKETGKTKSLKLSLGNIVGAAAMLSQPPSEDGSWGVAEGWETAAACIQLFGIPTWAAISSGNLQNIKPPLWAKRGVIYADNDHNGAGVRAARKTRETWLSCGYFAATDIEIQTVDEVGKDFADMLLARAA
jgi:CHC2 zinc finger/Toprim domain